MRRPLTLTLIVAALLTAILLVHLAAAGVWLPDVFSGSERVLAAGSSTSGYHFHVVQRWGADFYTTRLSIQSPDGHTVSRTLDGDDSKSWSVPLSIDEAHRQVTVVLGGGRLRSVPW